MTRVAACLLVLLALVTTACSSGGSGPSAGSAPAAGSSPVAGTGAAAVPAIDWRPCGGAFQCATVPVPLDYRRPSGPTISLAAIRLPATDPANRIGTLAVNFGGPGSPGVADLRRLARRFDGVRARMDVLAVDPRGVGGSAPVRCGPLDDTPFTPAAPPLTPGFWAAAGEAGRACAAGSGELLGHLSTANTARDLDLVRRSLGEEQLSLYGYSYGTYAAATYANLFPGRVRAMVVDGALDLAANAGGPQAPVDVLAGVPEAREEALGAFADACDLAGPLRCALAGGARARLADALAGAARTGGSAALAERVDEGLSSPGRLRGLARSIAASPTAPSGGDPGTVPPSPAPWVPAHSTAFLAIQCTDSVTPDAATMDAALARAQAEHPFTGAPAVLSTAACVGWPGVDPDRYLGPWNAPLPAPALVINTRYDPATPLANARAVASQLSSARLLVVDGFGHTTLDAPSRCAQGAATAYLLDPAALPPEGTVCPPDGVAFA